jgi:hypothetical protein
VIYNFTIGGEDGGNPSGYLIFDSVGNLYGTTLYGGKRCASNGCGIALTRRARKHSALSAVVVRFSRARKRYERQGVLVEESALEQAEAECSADADQRNVRRERAEIYRDKQDQVLAMRMAESIRQMFPGCPPEEAQAIAAQTSVRGSGRVGRTASGRALEEEALRAAVVASIRHRHTKYDRLLMKGLGRMDARDTVRDDIDRMLESWRRAPS